MLSITSSANPARSMRAMIASRSSRATTSSATTGTNAVTMRSRSRRADARSCPPSRASASTPRAGCHSSGTSGGCNTTEATGRTIRAARRPGRPHTSPCEQPCADGHIPADFGRLAPALDRDRHGVAYRFGDPEGKSGGAPQPGRLIRRRLAGHSGDRGLDDHDVGIGSRVLAVDGTTRVVI